MPYANQIFIEVDTHDAIEGIELLQAKMQHLEVPTAEAALLWSQQIGHLFATAPWPTLRESTIRLKAAMGYPSDSLVRTGTLKDSTTGGQWSITGGVGQATAVLPYPKYGAMHITGFQHRSAGFVPARDWSMLDEPTIDKMVEAFADYITEGL